ncbi:hypothetical protein D3C76_779140 [compost metagenome]
MTLNVTNIANSAMTNVCTARIMKNGKASAARSHSLSDIKAIARNSDRLTFPSTETSRSNTWYKPSAESPLRKRTPTNNTHTKVGNSNTLPWSRPFKSEPANKLTEISASVSINEKGVIERSLFGCSKPFGSRGFSC